MSELRARLAKINEEHVEATLVRGRTGLAANVAALAKQRADDAYETATREYARIDRERTQVMRDIAEEEHPDLKAGWDALASDEGRPTRDEMKRIFATATALDAAVEYVGGNSELKGFRGRVIQRHEGMVTIRWANGSETTHPDTLAVLRPVPSDG